MYVILLTQYKRYGNYSEPCKFIFCEYLHSYRMVNLYGEVTTWAKGKLHSSDFAKGVLNSYTI